MYLYGSGVDRNLEDAWDAFVESTQSKSDGYSYYMLGMMSEDKNLHPRGKPSPIVALEFYNSALDRGYVRAKERIQRLMNDM